MSQHRKHHHILEEDRFLFFFKSEEKATKAILGAVYNLSSRVIAGVLAGFIVAHAFAPNTQVPATNAAGTAAIN